MAEELMRELEELRERLAGVDGGLVELVAERQRLASRIGRVKAGLGLPTRDFRQEREVLERVHREAEARELEGALAAELFERLIRSSLAAQERDRVAASAAGSGRTALVIGGGGRMGRWLVRFLISQGFDVEVADPAGAESGVRLAENWRDSAASADLVAVAATLEASRRILARLLEIRPRGLVFDIASLKGPLRRELEGLAAAGVRVTSIHPLFGPDTELLSNRHVIFIDLGLPEAVSEARALFSSTMAELVEMELAQHDRLMAFVLGLSHASNLAFAAALAESGEAVPKLAEIGSTTFDEQLAVSARVVSESPELYFEIQAMNEFGDQALDSLSRAVDRIRRSVAEDRREDFVRLMREVGEYLSSRRPPDAR